MTAALPARATTGGLPAPQSPHGPVIVPVPRIASLRRSPRWPGGHLGPLNLHSQVLPPSFLLRLGHAWSWGASVGCPSLHASLGGCCEGLWGLQCWG